MAVRRLKIEVFEGKKPRKGGPAQWFFHLLWKNGRVAVVSEGYVRFTQAFKHAAQMYDAMLPGVVLVVPEAKITYLRKWAEKREQQQRFDQR